MAKLGSTNVYGDLGVSRNLSVKKNITVGDGVTLSEATDRADLLLINSDTDSWCGIQITNKNVSPPLWSFMADGSAAGIYDDLNSDWHVYCTQNGGVGLRHNGATKLDTTSTGITVTGTAIADFFSGNGSSLTSVDADTLDGINSTAFAQKAVDEIISGKWKVNSAGNIAHELDVNAGYVPFFGQRSDGSSATGAIKIALPTNIANDMISGWIDISQYSGSHVSIYVKGYTNSTWANASATVLAPDSSFVPTVRLGYDGTSSCIWIGETSKSWSFPQVILRDWQFSYTADIDTYINKADITFESTFDTVTQTFENALTASRKPVDFSSLTSVTFTDNTMESGGTIFCTSGSTQTFTLSSAPAGFQVAIIKNGAGDVNFTAGVGQTIVSKAGSTPSLTTQHAAVTLIKRTSSEWTVIGDIE